MWTHRIGYAYYIASLLKRPMTYKRAQTIAKSFTEEELRRIYLRVKARSV